MKLIKTLSKIEEIVPTCRIGIILFIISILSFSASAQNTRVKWSSFSGGFGVSNSGNTRITSSAGQTFTGTNTGFLVDYSLIITDVKDELKVIPTVFKLNQNYPNPFNPSTIISYQIPAEGFVTLKVYDILGNEISTLVNEEKTTGNYNVSFNAGKISSGVYFFQLKARDFVDTKKMILLR